MKNISAICSPLAVMTMFIAMSGSVYAAGQEFDIGEKTDDFLNQEVWQWFLDTYERYPMVVKTPDDKEIFLHCGEIPAAIFQGIDYRTIERPSPLQLKLLFFGKDRYFSYGMVSYSSASAALRDCIIHSYQSFICCSRCNTWGGGGDRGVKPMPLKRPAGFVANFDGSYYNIDMAIDNLQISVVNSAFSKQEDCEDMVNRFLDYLFMPPSKNGGGLVQLTLLKATPEKSTVAWKLNVTAGDADNYTVRVATSSGRLSLDDAGHIVLAGPGESEVTLTACAVNAADLSCSMDNLKVRLGIDKTASSITRTAGGFSREEISAMYRKLDGKEYKYRISGKFADPSGKPLIGVTADISEKMDIWNEQGTRRRTEVFDSDSFGIESSAGCAAMSASFHKYGYYSQEVAAGFSLLDDCINGGATRLYGNIIVAEPRTIVLAPVGRITPKVMDNDFYCGFIQGDTFREPDDKTVLKLETTYPFWDVLMEGKGRSGKEFRAGSENELPATLIYAWPCYDEKNVLTSVKLTSNIQECYFLPQPVITDCIGFQRGMKLAPIDGGYVHDIVIPASEFDRPHYYYVRICTGYPSKKDVYYGKMSVSEIRDDGCLIKLYINCINDDDHKREINPGVL
ncbi:MAG: hypothetical protein AB7F40_10175 [Victivallaceae bacterium]|nr:hypothetical protein [Victivallaceae bacterium]